MTEILDLARTWRPVDLAEVLSGAYRSPVPSVGARSDGIGLFYPGRVHTIIGETEGGKTWVALLACRTELDAGHHVIYLDFEDDAAGVVGRLLALGVAPDTIAERFHYLHPEEQFSDTARGELADLVVSCSPTLAVLDGVTEAMSLFGLELKDNTDTAKFNRRLLAWLAALGPAVVTLDHVVKDREARGLYAMGAAHKINGLNGATYILVNRSPFGEGVTGRSTIYIRKDRPAGLRKHALPARDGLAWFADLVIESTVHYGQPHLAGDLYPPEPEEHQFRPTRLMKRVSDALQRAGQPLNARGVLDRVTGKQADIRAAVAALVDEGYVAVEGGPRGAQLHRLVKPYEEK